MYRNYLAAALRNLARNRLYAGINIVGLAIGFVAAILIALFVRDEFSYDRWIPGYERAYLLTEINRTPGRGSLEWDQTQPEIAGWLKLGFPSVQAIARFAPSTNALRRGDIEETETVYWADPNIFEVLSLPVIAGDLKTALEEPDSIVLTRRMARKYFGRDDPVGEIIELDRRHPMQVRAVLDDLPSNTHLNTEIIASGNAAFSPLTYFATHPYPLNVVHIGVYTYLRLAAGFTADDLQRTLLPLVDQHMRLENGAKFSLSLMPIAAVHLHPDGPKSMKPHDDVMIVYAVGTIGVLITIIASINFVNLMTARAVRRAIEVGIRKVAGADRRHLIAQFIGELLIYVTLGLIIAMALAELLLPTFNAFLDRTVVFNYWRDPVLACGIVGLVLAIGILAGFYPAFVLSAFKPAAVLKGGVIQSGGSGVVRQSLVVLQFAILTGLILATVVIYQQTEYALSDGMRVDKDQVLMVKAPCNTAFKEEVRALPGVRSASCSHLGMFGLDGAILPVGSIYTADGSQVELTHSPIDFDFFEVYGLQPLAGRLFSRDRGTDAVAMDKSFPFQPLLVLNETAVRKLGFASPEAAVGHAVTLRAGWVTGRTRGPSEIIGVVRDFSMGSVRQAIEATVYYVDPDELPYGLLNIKLNAREIPETLRSIDRLWEDVDQVAAPINRVFLDRHMQDLYVDITRQAQLFATFSGVALFIACLGLFGLSAFTAERRTKEIGIRKAMGARRWDIVKLLVGQFIRPVLWANLIAWPVGGYFLNRWLHGFAYHVNLELWIFLAAAAVAVIIALATVSAHAYLVARARPVIALRHE